MKTGSRRARRRHAVAGTATRSSMPVIVVLGSLLALLGCDLRSDRDLTQPPAGDSPADESTVAGSYDAGEVLVRVAPGADVERLNEEYGTWTGGRLDSERVFLLKCPPGRTVHDLLPIMAVNPYVETAEPNYRMQVPEAEGTRSGSMGFADSDLGVADVPDQSALRRIQAAEAQVFARGAGILVAVLDTGVDPDHPLLVGRVASGGADFVNADDDPRDAPDGRDSDGDGLVDEALGHGTAVSALVLAVAPEAAILPIRILDSDGIGTAFDVARGLAWAERRGAQVVNMSFGMGRPSRIVSVLLERLHERGAVLVGSAGNRNLTEPPQFPAASARVIAVAATDSLDLKADFSNFGSWVSVSAPGVGLLAPALETPLAVWSGTSFAAALVSGEAALLRSASGSGDGRQLRWTIRATAVPLAEVDPTFGAELGSGRIDVLTAVQASPLTDAAGGRPAQMLVVPESWPASTKTSETGSR